MTLLEGSLVLTLPDFSKGTTFGLVILVKGHVSPKVNFLPSLQPVRKNPVVRQPNAFQSEHTTSSKNRVPQKVDETNDLSKPVTSNSVPTPQESKIVKHDNVIAPGMFRINPFKPSREEKNGSALEMDHVAEILGFVIFNGKYFDLQDISFLHVFGALCYPKNDLEDIGKLGAKGDIGFFIGYSADSCAYRVYNRRTKKIMETMNVTFDELSAMVFEQSSSKPGLQSMTSGQISSGLDLTYASSTITTQQPSEGELDLLFEAMYDDHIGGHPSAAPRTVPTA
ncbi:hypothetical protein Tco_0948836 [Tanacetum coccineum]